jgi:hypothetical protein
LIGTIHLEVNEADEDCAAPNWHRHVILKLTPLQNKLNAEGGTSADRRVYKAQAESIWNREDLREEVGSLKAEVSLTEEAHLL